MNPAVMLDPAIGDLIVGCFALLFVSAAGHKLRDLPQFAQVFAAYGIAPVISRWQLSWLVPVVEIAVALGMLLPPARSVAVAAGATLLLGYAIAIGVNLRAGRTAWSPAVAAGQISSRPIAGVDGVAQSAAGWSCSSVGITILPWDAPERSAVDRCGRPSASAWLSDRAAVLPVRRAIAGRAATRAQRRALARHSMTALAISNIVLWLVVICLVLVLLALTRQLGVLHERIAPAGALMINRGPAIGEAMAVLDVVDPAWARAGASVARNADGRSTLVLFVSPTCPVCKVLLPAVISSRDQERDWLDVVLASDGEPADYTGSSYSNTGCSDCVPIVLSPALGLSYQVNRLPFAALIDAAGRTAGARSGQFARAPGEPVRGAAARGGLIAGILLEPGIASCIAACIAA
jgi:methylamine dehydrogenase accessory protein MauD